MKGKIIAPLVFLGLLCLSFSLAGAAPGQGGEGAGQAGPSAVNPSPIVVTATRLPVSADKVGSSIEVITRTQLEQSSSVVDALRRAPSLTVVSTGGPGQPASVFLRGSKPEHTAVFIDGLRITDPMSTGRSFDFSKLNMDNIERIEVLAGPQSTLYGSDAMGGVINIITRKGRAGHHASATFEGGSNETFLGRVGVDGREQYFNYALEASYDGSKSISAAGSEYGNTEDDRYHNYDVNGRVGLTPTANSEINFLVRYNNAEGNMDNFGGVGGDDPNHEYTDEQLNLMMEGRLSLFDDFWEQKLMLGYTKIKREDNNDPDYFNFDYVRSNFNSHTYQLDWQHNLYLHETNTLVAGFAWQEEEGDSDYYSDGLWGPYYSQNPEESLRIYSFYLQDQISLFDCWHTTIGGRVDDNNEFDTAWTYRVTTAYVHKPWGATVRGSIGSGFKAPSLYQLYSEYGDKNLDEEKSWGWDIGLEQALWERRIVFKVTYFENNFDDMIDYSYITSKYVNVSEAKISGVELSVTFSPLDNLYITPSYTYLDAKDKELDEKLLRRPEHKFGLDMGYSYEFGLDFLKKGTIGAFVQWVDKREDRDFNTGQRVDLDSYTLLNLYASVDLTDNLQIFGRLDNVFDEDYEEVRGYGTLGFCGYLGVKVSF